MLIDVIFVVLWIVSTLCSYWLFRFAARRQGCWTKGDRVFAITISIFGPLALLGSGLLALASWAGSDEAGW